MNHIPSEKEKKRFQQAMEAFNNGRPKEAIRLFEKVLKMGGSHPDIWYLMGLAYGRLGEMAKVKQVSMRCLEVAPDHYGALCNLANTLMYFGDSEGALENYAKAMKAKPGDETVINNLETKCNELTNLNREMINIRDEFKKKKKTKIRNVFLVIEGIAGASGLIIFAISILPDGNGIDSDVVKWIGFTASSLMFISSTIFVLLK